MPNTKSAIRRVKRVKKQTYVNRIRKGKYKSALKFMDKLLKEGDKAKIKKYFQKHTKNRTLCSNLFHFSFSGDQFYKYFGIFVLRAQARLV